MSSWCPTLLSFYRISSSQNLRKWNQLVYSIFCTYLPIFSIFFATESDTPPKRFFKTMRMRPIPGTLFQHVKKCCSSTSLFSLVLLELWLSFFAISFKSDSVFSFCSSGDILSHWKVLNGKLVLSAVMSSER